MIIANTSQENTVTISQRDIVDTTQGNMQHFLEDNK